VRILSSIVVLYGMISMLFFGAAFLCVACVGNHRAGWGVELREASFDLFAIRDGKEK
jgi:hypothetical protein